MNHIDAKGKACPMPVMMAKKEMDTGCEALSITVDNAIAVQNLTRLAESQGFSAETAALRCSMVCSFSVTRRTPLFIKQMAEGRSGFSLKV